MTFYESVMNKLAITNQVKTQTSRHKFCYKQNVNFKQFGFPIKIELPILISTKLLKLKKSCFQFKVNLEASLKQISCLTEIISLVKHLLFGIIYGKISNWNRSFTINITI